MKNIAILTAALGAKPFLFGILAEIKKPHSGNAWLCSLHSLQASLVVFFNVSPLVTFLAEAMLLWTTITEFNHLTNNVHHNIMSTMCPTAKTGLFGGAAFIALDASPFWLVCLILISNAREDNFDEVAEESLKGEYGQVRIADYDQSDAQSKALRI